MLFPGGSLDFNDLALHNVSVARQWAGQYGFKPAGSPADPQQGFAADAFARSDFTASEISHPLVKWMTPIYKTGELGQLCNSDDVVAGRDAGGGAFLDALSAAVNGSSKNGRMGNPGTRYK